MSRDSTRAAVVAYGAEGESGRPVPLAALGLIALWVALHAAFLLHLARPAGA